MAQRMVDKGVKSFCAVPLVAHDKPLGALNARARTATPSSRRRCRVAGPGGEQIAIAVENAPAYREIAELKDKLGKEKLYLEDEIRTELQLRGDRRRQPGSSAGAAADRDRRADRFDRPDPRRNRHRARS